MNRTQRLLELIQYLMHASEPVSLADLRDLFPDYQAKNEETARRKFERDKETLRQLGIVIRVVQEEESDQAGYAIDRTETFLPAVNFEEDEVLALTLLGRVTRRIEHFPLARQTREALRKIFYDRQDDSSREAARAPQVFLRDPAENPNQALWVERLFEAILRRKTLRTRYHTRWNNRVNPRDIDPYCLAYRGGGRLTLVGHCHLRGEPRTFLVERFEEIAIKHPRIRKADFEKPAGFDARAAGLQPPWLWEGGENTEVEIAFSPQVAWQVERTHARYGRFEKKADGSGRLLLEVRNPDALIAWCLEFGADARILRPPAVAERLRARVREILAHYGKDAPREGVA